MVSKNLIGSGILMIVAGIAPIVWEIYRMLTESSGIGALGGAVMSVFFVFVGIILVGTGVIKLRKDNRSKKYL